MVFNLLVFLGVVVAEVTCDCTTTIPEVETIRENQTGLLWNVTLDPSTNWTYDVTKINNIDIGPNQVLKQKIEEYFILFPSLTNSTLSFSVNQSLDKEDPFWINATNNGALSSLSLQVTCTKSGSAVKNNMIIYVLSVNEFEHNFTGSFPHKISSKENLVNGTTVFRIYPYINDKDVPRPVVTDFSYSLAPTNTNDGRRWFHIPIASSDEIKIREVIDFDDMYKNNLHILTVSVVVKANDDSGFSINKTLQIEILDVDDLPPAFVYPGCHGNCTVTPYTATTGPNYRGIIANIAPVKIEAKDQDTLNATIVYSIQPSPDNYHESFEIDPTTANIRQIDDVSKMDVLIIKATEQGTVNRFSRTATLLVRLSNDSSFFPSASTAPTDDKMKIIAIVVGAVSLVIIAILIFLIIFVYKRTKQRMMVSPCDGKSPRTLSEQLMSEKSPSVDEKVSQWKQTIDPSQFPVVKGPKNKLDPIPRRDESTETDGSSIKKKRPRKKKKRLMEIFDGTKKFEEQADPEFFQSKDKERRKRSMKSKNKRFDNAPLDISAD